MEQPGCPPGVPILCDLVTWSHANMCAISGSPGSLGFQSAASAADNNSISIPELS